MATKRDIRKKRREAQASFAWFVDWTYKWDSDYNPDDGTGYRLEPGDGTFHFINEIQHFNQWHSLDFLGPRGISKSTLNVLASLWTKWRMRHIQHLTTTATPDVAGDQYRLAYRWCSDHPLLEDMRPLNANESKRQFDVPGNRGKGRSFRWRTAGGHVTGGRCHWLNVDDLETDKTVATIEQRMKMRMFLSECHNLLYAGNLKTWVVKVGTPWDVDTIYRNLSADRNLEIPAIVKRDDGTLLYPYHVWTEEALERKRVELNNDPMFRSQYLMDVSVSDEDCPVKRSQIVFEAYDDRTLNNRTLLSDPAGGIKDSAGIRAIRTGQRPGDGMTHIAGGTKGNRLYISDIFSKSTTAEEFIDAGCAFVSKYQINRNYVENNFGGEQGWPHTMKMAIVARRLNCTAEGFRTTGKKLNRILGALVPLFGNAQVVFHERLRDNVMLVDEAQSQLLNLRWTHLPARDDVADTITMMVERLHPFLFANAPAASDNSPLAQARRAHAPNAVQRMLGASSASTIKRAKVYHLGGRR